MKRVLTAVCAAFVATSASAGAECSVGKTLTDGVLTIATGNPAYYPWVMDDAPESKQGFEAAVAYAIANEMGFDDSAVTWVRTSFDEAIQPGSKNFDFNMQQYSITPEREEMVDFSLPYYSSPMAILSTKSIAEKVGDPAPDALKDLIWGAMAGTTGATMIDDVVGPTKSTLLYSDNADVTAAMQAGQIDAALFDLPTALYLSAVVVNDGALLGQFPADRSQNPDQFGALMEDGNPIKACVDEAIQALTDSGKLAELEAEWLEAATGVPVIK
ncbi:ABC transporter substrate-binding protein [uncultured Shimia sp.]|uniref:ABC transporter substrate-binding protein n=1 Tax=uncultured Shimia sp. TaxID=573152 RepID=UPI00263395AD|nr:ABC transporter substrate-binding protein [uncultured Shimia sp.]